MLMIGLGVGWLFGSRMLRASLTFTVTQSVTG
jgi:hypothetical protein